jgi:hypothetical protein
MEQKDAELIVKIISILGYVGSGLAIVLGLVLIFGGSFIAGFLQTMFGSLSTMLTGLLVVFGILMIIFGIVALFVYMKLMKYVYWARIVVIVFAAIGTLNGLVNLPSGIIGLLINGAIFYFLTFQKDVIALFKKV